MSFPVLQKGIFLTLAVIFLMACAKDNTTDSNDLSTKIVVEGYIFANEPVDGIHISRVNSSGSSILVPVTDADVEIGQYGNQVQLSDTAGNSGIYSQDPAMVYLLPDTGVMQLQIISAGKTYTSTARFPSKLSGLSITNTQINLVAGNSTQTVASLTWNPVANASGYCIFMRNVSENSLPSPDANTQSSVFHRVVHGTSLDLKSTDFTITGTYDLYVTAVNEEYAAMYHYNGANNLITGASNIENGWGIFTAFNGMAVSVSVQ